MADIKRKISLEYQATGLEGIQKRISEIKPILGDADSVKEVEREIKELAQLLSSNPNKMFDPKVAEEYSKKYSKILSLEEKARLDMIALKNEDSAVTLKGYEEQILKIQEVIDLENEKIKKIEESMMAQNGLLQAPTSKIQKEVLDSAARELGPTDQMRSVKGRNITDPTSFLRNMSQLEDMLSSSNIAQSALIEKIRSGADLTEEELETLQKSVNERNKIASTTDQLKLSATEIAKQYKIKNDLLEYEQLILKENRAEAIGGHTDEIEGLKARKKLIEDMKESEEPTADSMGGDEESLRVAELSQKSLEERIKLQAEHERKLQEAREQQKKWNQEQKNAGKETTKTTKAIATQTTSLGKAAKQVFGYGVAFNTLRKLYRETIRTITELDAALTEMAVVSTLNRKEAWNLVPALQSIAKETGFATTEIAKLATVYFRQGRALGDVVELTTVAAKAARIAGISAQESANYLTSAVNGFGLAAKEAIDVSDKFAALAASSASSYEELATGLSKFAAQANVAGISIDFALGMLAKGVETTREAPETIGTALKTVIARMRELTDLGKTFEDGMSVNRVETALRQVGIQLIDTNGQFRDMESVLTEVGMAWDTLNTNQRASVAVALAGTRQQSRLIAIMNDFDRTLELVNISMYSQGATQAQHMEYMKSMAAATTRLETAWQKFITAITDSEFVISIIRTIANTINGIASLFEKAPQLVKGVVIAIAALTLGMKLLNIEFVRNLVLGKAKAGTTVRQSIATGFLSTLTLSQVYAQGELNRMTLKSILLDKLKIKSLWKLGKTLVAGAAKWIAYWVAAMGPVGWIIAGLAAIAGAVYLAIAAGEKWIKALKEERAELQKNIYETNKFAGDLKKLSDQIDEINNKPIKVKADYDELDSLMEQVKEIEENKGIKLTAYNSYGEKDYTQTADNLREYQEEQRVIILGDIKELVNNTLKLYEAGEASLSDISDAYANSIIANYEHLNGRVSENQREFLNSLIDSEIKARKERIDALDIDTADVRMDLQMGKLTQTELEEKYGEELIDILQNTMDKDIALQEYLSKKKEEIREKSFSTQLEQFEKFNKDYKAIMSKESLNEQATKFQEIIDNITDPGLLKSYKEAFAELNYLVEKFSGDIGETLDAVVQKLGSGAAGISDLSSKAREAGYDANKIISAALKRTEELMDDPNVSKENAVAIAYSEIASSIKDVEFATYLYGVASGKTMLSTSQEVDRLNSVIKNLYETQSKFLKGEMTQEEMFQFVGDNADLFEDEDILERFLNGEDISYEVVKQLEAEYQNYKNVLIATEVELKKLENATTKENIAKRDSLKTQRAQALIGLQYNGILRGLTQAEYDYNNALIANKRATDLGIESGSERIAMLEALQDRTQVVLLQTEESISQLKTDLTTNLRKGWESYVEIVDGVAVINTEMYKDLGVKGRAYVDNFVNGFNQKMDTLYEAFKELRDAEVKAAEDEAKKKKKIYEDYFAALDRLEDKRARKLSREDLVAQLQRLEGATDERSRQKAKELRKELNEFDAESKELQNKQFREDLLNATQESVQEVEDKFKGIWEDFVSAGGESGAALVKALRAAGYGGKGDTSDINNIIGNDSESPVDGWSPGESGATDSGLKLENPTDREPTKQDWIDAFRGYIEYIWDANKKTAPKSFASWKINAENFGFDPLMFDKEDSLSLHDYLNKKRILQDKKMPNDKSNWSSFAKWWTEEVRVGNRFSIPGYSEGGMVDYTGLAMVHGSSSKPEAFLNASQTEMFAALTSALAKISISGGNSENITIENITIQTQQLNNKQDFDAAGRVLADAFGKAIGRRGISVNAKR